MLRSILNDYSDAYILVKRNITVQNKEAAGHLANNASKMIISKNCSPFNSFISRTNNTQVDDAHDTDVVMLMYNLIEYSDNYWKTSAILWQYCRDEPAFASNGDINDFNAANATTNSFKIKEKLTGQTGNYGTKNCEIMVPLKYLSNIWRTLEMPLINYEINLDLNWSENCVIVATAIADQDATFSITNTRHYFLVVTFSTQDNAKLLEQLKSGFKRTTNWIKYQSKIVTGRPNQYLGYLIDPSLQGVNRLFVLSFEDKHNRQVTNDLIFRL